MIATRSGIARLIDWQAIWETFVLRQYGAISPQRGWHILDIGASIGDYSIWTVRHGAKCTAFECDKFCLPALKANAKRYGFMFTEQRITNLSHLPIADLIKIDIEGGEYNLIGWERYPRIILEYHTPYGSVDDLVINLGNLGYNVIRFPNRRRSDLGILCAERLNNGFHRDGCAGPVMECTSGIANLGQGVVTYS